MNAISSRISAQGVEQPAVLYHYTNFRAAEQIIKSGNLHATDIRYMNDGAEFSRAIHLMAREMKVLVETETSIAKAVFMEIADQIADYATRIALGQSPRWGTQFVACFSEDADSLSLWTRYSSAEATGIALWFDVSGSSILSSLLAACTYEDDAAVREVRGYVEGFLDTLRRYVNPDGSLRSDDRDDEIANLLWHSVRLCATYKNRAFQDEREWRILMDGRAPSHLETQYRGAQRMLVPYVEVSLCNSDQPIPIIGATIGPSPYASLARESMIEFFRSKGLTTAAEQVVVSEANYRVLGR